MSNNSAIIIGAGPSGLATALCLHQKAGIACKIYELRSQPTTLGGAIGLVPNGLRLMDRLGLLDALIAKGNSRSEITLHASNGSVLGQTDFAGKAQEETGYGYLRIKRPDLVEVLLEAVHKAGIPVFYGKRLVGVQEGEALTTATAIFSDNTTESATYLFGCDGIHSTVRTHYVDPDLKLEYSGLCSLFSNVESSEISEDTRSKLQNMNATLTKRGMFMATWCTPSGDEIYWGFTREVPPPSTGDVKDGWESRSKTEVAECKQMLLAALGDTKGEWGDSMRELVDKTAVMKFYPVYKLPPGGKWYKGRCLLLGDAAHAMQPHASQGVSMALEDAFLIARQLKDFVPSTDPGTVFEKYDQVRRGRVEGLSAQAARNGEMRTEKGALGMWVRETSAWAFLTVTSAMASMGWVSASKDLVYDVEEETL